MDSSLAVEATNLSKKYRLGTIGMSSLREDLSRWWSRNKQSSSNERNVSTACIDQSRMINESEFWALHDLNFQISKGEVVGLIGANGSGKSTLLKILSRITEPTQGEVKIRGKVASLLEVGTGFHPELTGRENVYVNGAILGMTRKEVDRKFDEIVDFAGVADFIETPIKRYSSGMTVRLGFAVAAHLDPDILIVDEVLAVGDASFQKKCLGKMEDISTQGRTIIFVSHQLPMIEALCNRSYLLDNGEFLRVGPTKEVTDFYLSSLNTKKQFVGDWSHRQGNGLIKLVNVNIKSSSLGDSTTVKVGEEATFIFEFEAHDKSCKFDFISFRFAISNHLGHRVTTIDSRSQNCVISRKKEFSLKVELPKVNFPEGTYFITTFIGEEETPYDWISNVHTFDVIPGNFYGTGRINTVQSGEILSEFKISQINAQNTN